MTTLFTHTSNSRIQNNIKNANVNYMLLSNTLSLLPIHILSTHSPSSYAPSLTLKHLPFKNQFHKKKTKWLLISIQFENKNQVLFKSFFWSLFCSQYRIKEIQNTSISTLHTYYTYNTYILHSYKRYYQHKKYTFITFIHIISTYSTH